MPYYWDDAQKISLPVPAGGVPGGGGGGLFGGLLGGGGGQQYGGLLGAAGGGDTDALMQQLVLRQLQRSMQPDWGKMSAAFAEAAMPSRLPVPFGAALGKAAGALSAGDDGGTKALQALKLMEDLRLAKRKAAWVDKFLTDDSSATSIKDVLGGPSGAAGGTGGGTPGTGGGGGPRVVPPLLPPRAPLSDVTSGDLSPTYGEPPTGEDTPDPDLFGGKPKPAAPVAAPAAPPPAVTKAALTGSAWELANNNFGGLRKPGVVAGPSQGGFQSFDTPEQGIAAISTQLDRYASGATTGRPLTTIREIVSTWAPPHENPTEALIARASRIVGAPPDAPLDLSNPQVKAKLIEATIANEQGGRVPVARDLISRVASTAPPPPVASTASGAPMPPPRMGGTWLDQPASAQATFNDPSFDHRGALERFRQTVLRGGAPASDDIDPSQSPTRALSPPVLPPPDEVIRAGPAPAVPGLLRAQYSSQSPTAQMGGGAVPMAPPMPGVLAPPAAAAPAAPPMAPGAGPVQVPTVPMPPNMDPRRIQGVMLDLARKSAQAQALGLPDIYGHQIQVLQNSPQYKAMIEAQTEAAKLPFKYADPQHNPEVQSRVETAKQTAIQLGKYLGPEYDETIQKMLKDIDERAKAPYGTPVEVNVELPDGTQRKQKITPEEFADFQAGKGIRNLPPGARIVGETVRSPGQQKAEEAMGTSAADALKETHAAELAAGRRTQLYGQMAQAMEGFKPGATAEIRMRAGQIYKDVFGGDMPSVPAAETFQQAARQLQLAAAPKGQGSVSNYERELYASAVPTMVNSPETLAKAIDIARRLDEYDIKVAQIHRQVARDNRGVPDLLEAQDRVAKLGPPLSPGEMRALETIREGKVPGPAATPQAKPSGGTTSGGTPWRRVD